MFNRRIFLKLLIVISTLLVCWKGGKIVKSKVVTAIVLPMLIMVMLSISLNIQLFGSDFIAITVPADRSLLQETSPLSITVSTDKPCYLPGETICIYGNLTSYGSPAQGLVGIEVDDPNGYHMVVRTLETGSPPPGDITIIDLYPSNLWGQPKENFNRGYIAYFFLNLSNDGTVAKNITITINAYDQNMVPLGVNSFGPWLTAPGTCVDTILPILIPEWASLGNATVYGSVFTHFPKYGGTPHCPEKNATFVITGSGQESNSFPQSSGNDGNYSLTFRSPINAELGTYEMYVSSSHEGETATNDTIFGILLDTTTPPVVAVFSPQNTTYGTTFVSLVFSVNKATSWIGYSLDNQANVTITENTTLTNLAIGSHSMVVYANDICGNIGYSDEVYFTVQTHPVGGIYIPVNKLELLTPYIALASVILVVAAATTIYVKHVKRRKKK
jgi:hypothetical protein